MFCLITDLHDYAVYPAAQLAGAYAWRWTGSETALKEAKSAIAGAGPSAGPILRSETPELINQEHAAWICGTELVRALARAAARQAAPARKGRTPGSRCSPGTSPSPPPAAPAWTAPGPVPPPPACPLAIIAALHRGALHDLGKRRIVTGRNRHRDRKTKTRQPFPAAGRGITTRTAAAQVRVCAPVAA